MKTYSQRNKLKGVNVSCCSAIPDKDFTSLHVLELVPLHHGHDGKRTGPLVVEPSQQLLHQLRIGDTGADGDSALDGLLDSSRQNA